MELTCVTSHRDKIFYTEKENRKYFTIVETYVDDGKQARACVCVCVVEADEIHAVEVNLCCVSRTR